MHRRVFFALLLVAVAGLSVAAPPLKGPVRKPAVAAVTTRHFILHLGRNITTVNRSQLLTDRRTHTLTIPRHLKRQMAKLPSPPAVYDWTKGNTLSFPILGNDQYGDCYYAAVCHQSQTYTGNSGTECSFDENAVIRRYLAIAGGDNGLDDGTIMPEWKGGIVGPNGPRKILDEMTVVPTDKQAIALAQWAFGGTIFTASLLDSWLANPQPGQTWDAGGTPDPTAGHAMVLNGKDADGTYRLQTWGFNPPIKLTQAGLEAADPELIVAFSLDWFNPKGYAPNGLHYTTLSPLWQTLGGVALPASPFPPPGPPVPPVPPPVPPVPVPPAPAAWSMPVTGGTVTFIPAKPSKK